MEIPYEDPIAWAFLFIVLSCLFVVRNTLRAPRAAQPDSAPEWGPIEHGGESLYAQYVVTSVYRRNAANLVELSGNGLVRFLRRWGRRLDVLLALVCLVVACVAFIRVEDVMFLVALALFFLLMVLWLARWWAFRRVMRKLPKSGERCEVIVSEQGFEERRHGVARHYVWSEFDTLMFQPEGIMLLCDGRPLHYWPEVRFVTSPERETIVRWVKPWIRDVRGLSV